MSDRHIGINDLAILLRTVATAVSLEAVAEAAARFLHGFLPSAQVTVTPTAVFAANIVGETAVSLPIGRSGFWLNIQHSEPFTAEDAELLQTAVSLLTTAPLPGQTLLTTAQLSLLQRLNQIIIHNRPLHDQEAGLQQAFRQAFPHASARLFWQQTEPERLDLQLVFGQPVSAALPPLDGKKTAVYQQPDGTQLVVPLQLNPKNRLLLLLEYGQQTAVSPSDLAAAELLAGQLGVVVNNGRLFEIAWDRANQLETIFRVTEYARLLKPLAPTLQTIHEQIQHVFKTKDSYIALYDAEKQLVSFPSVVDQGVEMAVNPISIYDARSLAVWVVTNNLAYTTGDWLEDAKPVPGLRVGNLSRSIIAVPIRLNDEVLGVISVQSERRQAFAEADLPTLTAVADHVATIIKNATLYAQAKELVEASARDHLAAIALRQAITAIGDSLDHAVVVRNFLQTLGGIITYDTAYLFLWQDQRLVLADARDNHQRALVVATDELESIWNHSTLTTAVLHKKEPLSIADVVKDSRWVSLAGQTAVRSWMGVPLGADNPLGLLVVNSFQPNAFSQREERLVSTLAAHAAVAIQNALLHHQTQQQLSELSILYQASATMSANLDQGFVLHAVAREMVQALQVDSCLILVQDEASSQFQLVAQEHYAAKVSGRQTVRNLPSAASFEVLAQHPALQQALSNGSLSLRQDTVRTATERELLEQSGFRSVLFVPLQVRDKVLGLLLLGQLTELRSFPTSVLRLARNLASQAAVAIEHARLYERAQQRVAELSAFHEIVLHLNMPLDLRVVLDTITDSALRLTQANNVHIYLYDNHSETFTFGSALWRDGRRHSATKHPRSNGITATVVRRGEPVVINSAATDPLYQSAIAQTWGIAAIAGFPLKYDDEVIGAFTTTYLSTHTFTDDELLLLNLLADQAAVAVKNARLYAQTERRLLSMSALVDMAKQITGKLKLRSVLNTTVEMLRDLLKARACTITMLSDDKTELVIATAAGISPEYVGQVRMKVGEGVSGQVVRTGEPVYIPDAHSEPDFLFFDEVVRSLIVVPLKMRDEVIGTLAIDSDQPRVFDAADVQLVTVAAAQVSVAIANARLFEELERHADELSVAYDELKENDRLKDELVQNVSHELRTPLTFVKGYVDLLIEGEMGDINAYQRESLQIVSDKTDEITRIIGDIVTLQRIDAANLEKEELSMAQLVRTTVSSHQLIAQERGLVLKHEIEPGARGMILADKDRINQVLNNLIGNAIKFSPDGGTVRVLLREAEGQVQVAVSDNGIGMPADQIHRIFDRFYQVDGSSRRRFGGTGLGLAIVKRILEAHDGAIWVESELEKGSTFYFTLPQFLPVAEAV